MIIKEIYPNVFLCKFDSQYELTSTLIRIQEFYESPYKEIRNSFFTLDQYMDIYIKDHKNKFTYFEDWSGFNFSSELLNNFKAMFISDLRVKEQNFIKEISKVAKEKSYIISVYKNQDIKHELAHALYYVDSSYKKEMDLLLEQNKVNKIRQSIKKMGYADNVLDDEIQAYLISGMKNKLNPKFRKVFKKYVKS